MAEANKILSWDGNQWVEKPQFVASEDTYVAPPIQSSAEVRTHVPHPYKALAPSVGVLALAIVLSHPLASISAAVSFAISMSAKSYTRIGNFQRASELSKRASAILGFSVLLLVLNFIYLLMSV